jgi:histone acetyltransferase (RNA polymerase elongator complex component)
VDSIQFSTRPDTKTPERLDFIAEYPVETVELGVQSMDDHILAQASRGGTVLPIRRRWFTNSKNMNLLSVTVRPF